jgi:hypothetical protein
MRKDRVVAELCDFGVIYSLCVGTRGVSVKVSWELPGQEEPCSCAFRLDLAARRLVALGRKNNRVLPGRFDEAKLCAWAQSELRDAL